MKKRFKYLVILLALVIATVNYIFNLSKDKQCISSMALKNIEALASGEGSIIVICIGRGEVTCPDGTKVDSYVVNVR